MKKYTDLLLILTMLFSFVACDDESKLIPTDDLDIPSMFKPGENEDPKVLNIYNNYGVWVRTHFSSIEELTNAFLAEDQTVARYGAENLDEESIPQVIKYSEDLFSNVSAKYTNTFFPLELFYVKTYGSSYWIYPVTRLGRSRLILMWPSTLAGTIPVEDPENHYYQDSVLTKRIWKEIGTMIVARMEEPILEFVSAGKPYDNGEAYDKINNDYNNTNNDYGVEERDADLAELARNGGFINGSGSRNFSSDFSDWITLLATESYENIKQQYLDNSTARALKYEILINYFKGYDWDIQAAGDKYRTKFNEYKATLPVEPEE